MSYEKFEEGCEGCRPAAMNAATGQRIPDDDPMIVAMCRVFDEASREEHEAWHRFTCKSDTSPLNMEVVEPLLERMQAAVLALDN